MHEMTVSETRARAALRRAIETHTAAAERLASADRDLAAVEVLVADLKTEAASFSDLDDAIALHRAGVARELVKAGPAANTAALNDLPDALAERSIARKDCQNRLGAATQARAQIEREQLAAQTETRESDLARHSAVASLIRAISDGMARELADLETRAAALRGKCRAAASLWLLSPAGGRLLSVSSDTASFLSETPANAAPPDLNTAPFLAAKAAGEQWRAFAAALLADADAEPTFEPARIESPRAEAQRAVA